MFLRNPHFCLSNQFLFNQCCSPSMVQFGKHHRFMFFLNILTFRGLFQVIKFNKPSKIYIFNFKLKVFDKMRILSSLRLLRLLRSLRPVRSLMPGKWLNMWSANCHSHQKGINRPKMLKIFFERSFTFGTFKLFVPPKKFACLQIGP